jgi:hypothetical protein
MNILRNNEFNLFTTVYDCFKTRTVSFEEERDLFIIHHLILKYKKINWQLFFETRINSNLVYQNHFFLQKINKKGKQQSRIILITNKVNF